MSFIIWIIFGALAGWIASLIMKTNKQQGLFLDIVMGILGAMIGGFLSSTLFNISVTNNPFNPISLAIAVVGAVILTMIVRAVSGKRT
ncbi:MAG: GlsB/YeaQ/YmgE family stress response membrane protein [Chloroflexi bacterium AL-W]|nr:GlsB/YeaQ/YmgE family stress response membrane protein [Chloroflexi bacterium AL-N1]NOK69520.1 GlsB/YeaQ/YmgE family stress response membrane protein [Chloroflexi bacterium AL-N10]NOK77485.1 GlsB/YeaQ/YmgE family stress response membrane protein [Chloroflexi bacterium AL-N5]NOK84336.1 GlsB/YeaQ/YmgE family stress response membrane protein [Chloroflexi bacterium AL-W]NOK91498.1 GlsB/YeaQ/YmgE family stress response membrane protein [Chloroflexi bacterium AL-N15]